MTEQQNNNDDNFLNDDVEGHRLLQAEGGEEDLEGHRFKDVHLTGDDDDVEGHRFKDVQVQPPRDTDLGGTEH